MNEWFKKLFSQLKSLWAKWSLVQKIILIGIVVVVIGVIIFVSNFSASPTTVPIFSTPITDEIVRSDIIYFLDTQGIETTVSTSGVISVKDKYTAKNAQSLLIANGKMPNNVDPWEVFDMESWTLTDMQRNVNLQRSLQEQVKQHIIALNDVDNADVIISFPEKALFASEQNPVKASVSIYAKPGSDIMSNKTKIQGIERLLEYAIDGLTSENITIIDAMTSVQVNDFEGMEEIDRITIVEKQQKLISKLEAEYRDKILRTLQSNLNSSTTDRVRDLNLKIDMDFSTKKVDAVVYSPITIKEDNKDTPYDDSEYINTLPLSMETVEKTSKGTAYNPEGPAGVEGQTSPVYSDLSNLFTLTEEKGQKVNNVINTEQISEEKQPTIDRVTVAVNVDGTWKLKIDPETKDYIYVDNEGNREWEYIPAPTEEIQAITDLVKDAIGYNAARGDSVTVRNIQINRDAEHAALDAEYARKQQTQKTILYVGIGVIAVLLAFILFRAINRHIEKKRKEREDELLRRQQMEHDRILLDAEQADMVATLSVEERERAELQEHAVAMAREHPEDVAMLIRTWLMEE